MKKYKTRISILIALAAVVLTLLCIITVYSFHTGEEATVGIFSLAATLVGTIFIAVELKNGSEVTCSEMLINLNNNFHESDRLMMVYEILEQCDADQDFGEDRWANVPSVAVAQYCTFFENLYLLYRHHIASIDDLDDLFGYRFFIFMNNQYIQEHYILPTSSSYVQIFELYNIWIKHRKKENEGKEGWQRFVPGAKYRFSDDYLSRKLYLFDNGTSEYNKEIMSMADGLSMRVLGFDSLGKVLGLQQRVCDEMANKELFYPLSRDELIESIHLDEVSGIFSPSGELVAFCVIVSNRKGKRNLASYMKMNPMETMTFDIVVVDSKWRGRHFQQIFIDHAIRLAKKQGADRILATVSPDNSASKHNFLVKGFKVIDTREMYNNVVRDIICLERND